MSVSHDMGPAGTWGHRNRSPGSAPICLLHTWFSAHAVLCTHGSVHMRFSAHAVFCTRGSLHTRFSAHAVFCIHGSLHTRFSAHAVFCTRGSLYTWLLSPFTCKPFLFTQCLESLPTAVPQLFLPFPTPSCPGLFCHTWQVLQNLPANAGDIRFDPWVRKIPWRRAWQPIPVFLPGESH